MSILHKHIPFVKEQIDFQKRMEEKFASEDPSNSFRVSLHRASREKFMALAADLDIADKELDKPAPTVSQNKPMVSLKLSVSSEELEGLPEELLKELSISQGDKSEFAIINIIDENGGMASLDQLIIGVFRKTGETFKRQAMTSKLYRMGGKEMVFSVPTKKGVYSTRPISEEEAILIFGGAPNMENINAGSIELLQQSLL
jgi:hypothetical protein